MTRLSRLAVVIFSVCASASLANGSPLTAVPRLDHSEEQRAPLDAVNAFFAAVETKSRKMVLAAVVPEGLATLIRLHDGASPTLLSRHWATYVEDVVQGPDTYTEHINEPRVLVERDMAMVWGRFEVYANGKFSHCGVDQFQLVRKNGRWLIYNLTWTSQLTGCPAAKR